ncbi:COX15/CtaA family protein [Pedobacter arcticus]|uniref:COX15/CtaA family protein n=1 Tax=Pedobacter arcticus TaxID=752140 RepID=UPI00030ECD4A|nr:COX15/CtaA family protein [Pedobacter arcticus]
MYSKAESRFLSANFISLIALFLLILAGGIVRSSGSGMGCPDWPKCFDQYIPPTELSQLPANYKEKYVLKRIEKNERFAKLLDKMGYGDLAIKIRHDESIKVPEEFNPGKTYTEYINRLIGATTGLLLLICFALAIPLIKTKAVVFWLSALNLFLVGFQGWLGSIVVSTNLLAWMITVHMLVAVLIFAISIYTYFLIRQPKQVLSINNKQLVYLRLASLLTIVVSVWQITIGTEVREEVDAVKSYFPELVRSEWLAETGRIFTEHKQLVWLYLVVSIVLYALMFKFKISGFVNKLAIAMLVVFGLQVITGIALAYFAMAPWAQAAHVLLATVLFGVQAYILFIFYTKKSELISV